MNNSPLVSIIIPVYNKEKYLKDTINCITQQIYKNIEVILIDDGSTDNSKEIIIAEQNRDNRIKLCTQDNKGAAEARNKGLEMSQGQYVVFLDADDYFSPEMISKAVEKGSLFSADVVVWGYEEYHDSDGTTVYWIPKEKCIENADFMTMDEARTVPWNKLLRRDFLIDENICFQNLPTENDVFFSNISILMAKKIAFIDKPYVKYNCGVSGSITSKRIKEKSHVLLAYNRILEYLLVKRPEIADLYIERVLDWIWGRVVKQDDYLVLQSISIDYPKCNTLQIEFNRLIDDESIKYRNRELIKCLNCKRIIELSSNRYSYIRNRIEIFIKEGHKNGEKTAIWGCGKKGGMLLDSLNDIRPDYAVDIDDCKTGTKFKEYTIKKYEEIINLPLRIIVMDGLVEEYVRRETNCACIFNCEKAEI